MYVLIGQRFRVGAVECFGQRRCEPCAHLEQLTHAWSLRFHPLDPLRPPLRRLERLSEVQRFRHIFPSRSSLITTTSNTRPSL